MGDGVRAVLVGDVDQVFGNQRPGDRSAQQVLALIHRAGAQQREEVIFGEFFFHIVDYQLGGSAGQGFFLQAVQLFLLADVGCKTDHLTAVVLLQPGDDHRGVQPAGIRQNDFFDR